MSMIVSNAVKPTSAKPIGKLFLLPDGRKVSGEVINWRAATFINRLVANEPIESVVADLLESESEDRWIRMVGYWADCVLDQDIESGLRESISCDFESELRRQKTEIESRIKEAFDEEYASMRQWYEANR